MNPTEVLMAEHRLIERVLDALEAAAYRLRQGVPVPASLFLQVVEFLRGLADGSHHRKEEEMLFPAMTAAGLPPQGGPVGMMLTEHGEGRRLVGALQAAALRLQAGEEAARDDLVPVALRYVELLRDHIGKEDEILFPMAEQVVAEPAWTALREAFDRDGQEAASRGEPDRFLALVAQIEGEVNGPPPAERTAG